MLTEKIRANLDAMFNPRCVGVIGASEKPDKLGYHVMKSLTAGTFEGRIVPVNPSAGCIMGLTAVRSLAELTEPLDLAVIAVPARTILQVFDLCRIKGVKGVVLITAGFKEISDPAGADLQSRLAAMARQAEIPVIGPNTFGMVDLQRGLNASFTPEFSLVKCGDVSLVSQSGGISHLLGFMAMRQNVRMAKIVGLGNRLNIDFAEMVSYLGQDPETGVIALYLEGQDDPRRLMAAAAEVRGRKPIVALKVGVGDTGDRASLAHTGSLAGRREIYDGVFRQSGVLGVRRTEDLLDMAHALSVCPLPGGPRIAVLSGQAGPSMAACDVCEAEGLTIPPFGAETQEVVNGFLPPLALRSNPVDMGPAWYNACAMGGIVDAVLEDDRIDGVLLLMMFASANRETVPTLARHLMKRRAKKPVVTCLLAPPGIWDAPIAELETAKAIVNLPSPERAARTMAGLWRYRSLLTG